MKYEHGGLECPNPKCGFVMHVLYAPWPYTGEWMIYERPQFCPKCGHDMKEAYRDRSQT